MFKDQTWTVYSMVLGFALLILGGLSFDDYFGLSYKLGWPFLILGGIAIGVGYWGIKAAERK